jgi:putative transposase
MSAYRRLRVPGTSYFFTVNLQDRGSDVLVRHIDILRRAWADTLAEHPFRCDAAVILPDHLHAVWTLPPGDSDFSSRWRKIKARFTHATGLSCQRSASKLRKREAGLWQRRFWEHAIRDADDHAAHVGYCRENPVKHGLVAHAEDWPFSSVHRDIRLGSKLAKAGEEVRWSTGER